MIRVGILGASHWHLSNYLGALRDRADVRVVGVSDPDPTVAARWGSEIGCEHDVDIGALLDRTRPDFVVALGRHADMAATGLALADRGIAFAMEKPCGLDADQVGDLAARVAGSAVFAAVPFTWRQSALMDVVAAHLADDRFETLSMRIVSGHPDRYPRAGCAWMLDPSQSGGGSTINLAVHLIDLFSVLAGPDVELVSAAMSNGSFGQPIEDWSALLLRSGTRSGMAETGLLFPAETGTYEVAISIKTDRHYLIADAERTTILDHRGGRDDFPTPAVNEPTYRRFLNDAIDRFRRDSGPVAGMDDMVRVMRVVDAAYAIAAPPDRRFA